MKRMKSHSFLVLLLFLAVLAGGLALADTAELGATASHLATSSQIQIPNPYDDEVTYNVGDREANTGRYDRLTLIVDPVELQNEKERNNLSFVKRIMMAVWHFIIKTLASLLSLIILSAYFIVFYFIFWKRKMYEEFWKGMANQYQQLPEDRIYMVNLPDKQRLFWEKLRFSCRHLRSINGILINTMYKIRKIEGQIDPQDYIFDNHMFEIEGMYAMKDKISVDLKEFRKKGKPLDADKLGALPYPDIIDDPPDRFTRDFLNNSPLVGLTDPKDRKLYRDFIKMTIATKHPVYYPFIINIPMELNKEDMVMINGEKVQRTWFYFEVEIVKRLGPGINFIIGMLPAPYGEKTNGAEIMNEVYKPKSEFKPQSFVNPELETEPRVNDAIKDPEVLQSLKQPEWVNSYLMKLQKPNAIKVSKDRYYIEEWKSIEPGNLPDSVGFDVVSGKLKVSGGLEWAMEVDEVMKEFYEPDNIYKASKPHKSMAQQEEENAKKFQDEDDEGPHYIGDSFGIAYNAKTGYMFLTYNGSVLNRPKDRVNTLINMAILEKYDEEEKEFKIEDERKQMENPKYFRKLNLDNKIRKEVDGKDLIKINTSIKYIPCIYTDQNTKFRINFGASAFRNTQPEFISGLLYPFDVDKDGDESYKYSYLDDVIDDQAALIDNKPPL